MASSSVAKGHMRVPPQAGPRVVSWMQMSARRPDCLSVYIASSSYSYSSM